MGQLLGQHVRPIVCILIAPNKTNYFVSEAPVSKKLALSDGTVSPDQDVASAAATAALSGSTRVESEEVC